MNKRSDADLLQIRELCFSMENNEGGIAEYHGENFKFELRNKYRMFDGTCNRYAIDLVEGNVTPEEIRIDMLNKLKRDYLVFVEQIKDFCNSLENRKGIYQTYEE